MVEHEGVKEMFPRHRAARNSLDVVTCQHELSWHTYTYMCATSYDHSYSIANDKFTMFFPENINLLLLCVAPLVLSRLKA